MVIQKSLQTVFSKSLFQAKAEPIKIIAVIMGIFSEQSPQIANHLKIDILLALVEKRDTNPLEIVALKVVCFKRTLVQENRKKRVILLLQCEKCIFISTFCKQR